jgi:DNA modification methylase/tRNA1(Val) A37 N6-methylase TrmN6
MRDLDYLEHVLRIVKYARCKGIKNIDRSIWQTEDGKLPFVKERERERDSSIADDKSFYEKVNILLSNFEEEINNVPTDILKEETLISDGIVFTPVYLAKMVVEICKKYFGREKLNLAGDVSSGMGAFIYALNTVYPELNTLSLEKNKDLFQLSSILFEDKVNTILNLDTLRLGGEYQGKFDLIVGNPPYVRLQNIDSDTRKYIENNDLYQKNLFGSYDLSVAFIIKIVELLKEKGIAGLVLSRKIFLSAYGEKICRYLNEHVKILEIIDFGDNQMFRDKTTYTVIVVFQKEKSKESYSFLHCMIPVQHSLDEGNLPRLIQENIKVYDSAVLGEYPWNFTCEEEQEILDKFKKNGCRIQETFAIVQGFRTGDNKAFTVDKEGNFVRPYVDGKCIGRGVIKKTQKILWPYVLKNGNYCLIAIEELRKKNKAAYEHLLSTGKRTGCVQIHAYSRPQNMSAMDEAKIFVKEMMPRAEFAADCRGDICFGSGYALIPLRKMNELEIRGWSYLLSTEIMEYQYRLMSTNLHSGWFRMYKGHLEKIWLPEIDFEQEELQLIFKAIEQDPSDEFSWERLNCYVARKMAFSEEELEYITKYIEQCHEFSMTKNVKERDKKKMDHDEYKDDVKETAYPDLTENERRLYYPVELTKYNKLHSYHDEYRSLVTFQNDKTLPVQRWYKYTQGYSTVLVSKLIDEWNIKKSELIFDPFCGSGTTLLTAKNHGISSAGCDVSPLSCWISSIKMYDWNREDVQRIAASLETLKYGCDYNYQGLQFRKFFEKAFYPEILAQTMHIRKWIESTDLSKMEKNFLLLALVSIQEEISFIRKHGSHYRFLNDDTHVGVNKLNIELIGEESDITLTFKNKVNDMLSDIMSAGSGEQVDSMIICSDILELTEDIKADAVITSPPYLNRNNYFSQQKIELSLLKLIVSEDEYHDLVKRSFCSHVEADLPKEPVSKISEVNKIIAAVTKRKSNNAKIPHMIAGYFDDIDAFFEKLPQLIKPGAKIAFVVANCRWNGVVIPVDHLVCRIAEQYGFVPEKIMVARMKGNSPQQMQEFGKIPVRESIVILSYEKK